VKHEAATAHTFLDRLKMVKEALLAKTEVDSTQLGLAGGNRATQKYLKVCIGQRRSDTGPFYFFFNSTTLTSVAATLVT
jgi:hypothetical protein